MPYARHATSKVPTFPVISANQTFATRGVMAAATAESLPSLLGTG
jgi:hypothetical protein